MKSKQLLVLLVLAGTFSTGQVARAEAPVVDLSRAQQETYASQGGLEVDQEEATQPKRTSSFTHQNEPMDQRVLRLERQINNLTEMNYASKLEKMQQEVQQLRGQLEVQNHDLTQIKDQLKNFYQDLDQRLAKVSPESKPSLEKTTVASTENSAAKPTANEAPSGVENDKTKELQAYEAAFNLLNKKDYDKAISGFQNFVKDYPGSSYSSNAHYWLGEIYYLKGKSEQATKEFQLIISNYPESAKVADATLKVGLIAMDAGNFSKAKQSFAKVEKQFPGTTAAKVAALRLKEIKQKK